MVKHLIIACIVLSQFGCLWASSQTENLLNDYDDNKTYGKHEDEDPANIEIVPHIKIINYGEPETVPRNKDGIHMKPTDSDLYRVGRGRDSFLRFGRPDDSFIRFGRRDDFLRFGRGSGDSFIRFGRDGGTIQRTSRGSDDIEFGRRGDKFMRFGRAVGVNRNFHHLIDKDVQPDRSGTLSYWPPRKLMKMILPSRIHSDQDATDSLLRHTMSKGAHTKEDELAEY